MSKKSWRSSITAPTLHQKQRVNEVKKALTYAKLLILSLLLSLSTSSAQEGETYSTSDYVGFHVEVIKANAFTPMAFNVSRTPAGKLHQTINGTFGIGNAMGLKAGSDWRDADIIWIKDGTYWTQIYYNDEDLVGQPENISIGWKAVGWGDADYGDYYIPENNGFWIQSKKDVDWVVGFGGFVKRDATTHRLIKGFNSLNRGYPLPMTLIESGINYSRGFEKGINGDIVWLYRADTGQYDQYYYANGNEWPFFEGWRKIGSEDTNAGYDYIPYSLLIQKKRGAGTITIMPPAGLAQKKTVSRRINGPPKTQLYPYIEIWEGDGQPYFNAAWQVNQKLRYTTEVYEPWNGWFTINNRIPPHQELWTYDFARMLVLRWGGARVIAEWHSPVLLPADKNKN